MAIEVRIEKKLGEFKLNVSFRSDSRRIGILGASGCGKSMTLKSIAGIERPDEGRIAVNEKVLFDSGKRVSEKPQVRKIGYLFQNYALFPTFTVEENIAAGLTGKKKEIMCRVGQMVERFQLTGLEKRLPGELSGGQQQRVALARIFAYKPEVILLDEPFSALDVYLRDQMQRELMDILKDYQGTVIMVSHNRDEVYRMSEELLVLDDGKIVGQGKTKALFDNPGNIATARLTGCKNITRVTGLTGNGVYSEEWKMKFFLKRCPDKAIRAVAIRAHEFCTEEPKEGNYFCFPVLAPVITEDLFEYNISFKPSDDAKARVDWKISKYIWKEGVDKLPDKIYLKERDLLMLGDK